jgi:uncharacterized protein YbaR (Trm112 family)
VHIAVIELLRCPAGHEESPLVASATQQRERRILQGTLGCPVCGATYAIDAGIADFRQGTDQAIIAASGDELGDDAAVRLAAQLDLTEPGRMVLLFGAYARLAPSLSVMFDAVCIATNAPAAAEPHVALHASVLRIRGVLPLARLSLHGAAVDALHAEMLTLEQIRAVIRPKGRIVAPDGFDAPMGVDVLARDAREWVAVRGSDVLNLRRAQR